MLEMTVSVFKSDLSLSHSSQSKKRHLRKTSLTILLAQLTGYDRQQGCPAIECLITDMWNIFVRETICLPRKRHDELQNLIVVVFLCLFLDCFSDKVGFLIDP